MWTYSRLRDIMCVYLCLTWTQAADSVLQRKCTQKTDVQADSALSPAASAVHA